MIKTPLVDDILCKQLYNDLMAFALAPHPENMKIGFDILTKKYEVKHYRNLYFELYMYNDMYEQPITKIDYLYVLGTLIRKKLGIDVNDVDKNEFTFVI